MVSSKQASGGTPRGLILFSILITSFINPFLGAAINIALPAISREFSTGAIAMSWVSMAFLLSSAVFLVPFGKLADIRGRKRVFFTGNVITQPVLMAIVASISGRLSDRYDPRILASSGMSVIVVGLILLAFLKPDSPITYLGVASATVGTMRLTGQMMSRGIATLVLQIFVGNEPVSDKYTPDFMISMKTTFIAFAVLCILGVYASLARGKTAREKV